MFGFLVILVVISVGHLIEAWDDNQLAVFDLVDEIEGSFYDFLQVSRDANLVSIKKAFRTLSLVLHPDKSKSENAEIEFRNLVSIYEVLKDPVKRKYYDDVLDHGLPDWKSATFYYRRVRKLSMAEISVVLVICLAIGQYLFAWAVYLEVYVNQKARKSKRDKKCQKSDKKNVLDDFEEIETPKLWNTFPIQLPIFLWYLMTELPSWMTNLKSRFSAKRKVKYKSDNDSMVTIDTKCPKKRKNVTMIVPEIVQPVSSLTEANREPESNYEQRTCLPPKIVSGGFWSDDDINELIRLVNKYPGGVPDRWNVIANQMNRTADEIRFMAHKIKDNDYRPSVDSDGVLETKREKVKTRNIVEVGVIANSDWNQEQQKALEKALVAYPKTIADRWEKISNSVPHKTKDECINRYKFLVEKFKSQK